MKSFLEVEIVALEGATIGAKRVGSQETELVFRTSDSATLNEALRINNKLMVTFKFNVQWRW